MDKIPTIENVLTADGVFKPLLKADEYWERLSVYGLSIKGSNGFRYHDSMNAGFIYQVLEGDSVWPTQKEMPLHERVQLSMEGLSLLKLELERFCTSNKDNNSDDYFDYLDLLHQINYVESLILHCTSRAQIDAAFLQYAFSFITGPVISGNAHSENIFLPKLSFDYSDDLDLYATEDDFDDDGVIFHSHPFYFGRLSPQDYFEHYEMNKEVKSIMKFAINNDVQLLLSALLFCSFYDLKLRKCKSCGNYFLANDTYRYHCSNECKKIGEIESRRASREKNRTKENAKQRIMKLYDRSKEKPFDLSPLMDIPGTMNNTTKKRISKTASSRTNRNAFLECVNSVMKYQEESLKNGELTEQEFIDWINKFGLKRSKKP